jgi:hypothetical protein
MTAKKIEGKVASFFSWDSTMAKRKKKAVGIFFHGIQ